MQLLNPNYQALSEVHIEYARRHGFTGRGVGVAVLDSGIGPHIDFSRNGSRVLAFKDFVNERRGIYDDSSHGSHVCGIIGSNGRDVNNNIIGVAPECNLVVLKVLDSRGNGKVSHVIHGLRWVLQNKDFYGIKVVNISVGTPASPEEGEDTKLIREVNKLWDAGLVVVVAAGNNGPGAMSITTPGISRKVITVGSWDKHVSGYLNKDRAEIYSGRGPTITCVKKPDIVAPGTRIYSCNNTKTGYTIKSGTSMSTPIVSGAAALLLQKNPLMTNKEVKIKLKDSARDLGLDWRLQGWGMLDIKRFLS